jgi:lysine 2,3-aminomutase
MSTQAETTEILQTDLQAMMSRHTFSEEARAIVKRENLLPLALLRRLHNCYPTHSGFFRTDKILFTGKNYYTGVNGFREIVEELRKHGIEISHPEEREFFIHVYRFMATRHVLNSINWSNYENDSMYQLVFPQPGMIRSDEVEKYLAAVTDEARAAVVEEYQKKTNPHDGNQKLNKPWYVNSDGHLEILQGCQHKYPPVKLIFDKNTQNCFAFCTYCFRHAQVRGDEDMFVQHDVHQIHEYLRRHKEISDILITGGDGGFITYERLAEYVKPLIEDRSLLHVKTVRFGSRALTFHPELILTDKFTQILELMRSVIDSGIQMVWVAHLSTPRDILNPATVAAVRRLKHYGVAIKSQSPIMKHISLFTDENGKTDIDRSAQNWIDLGNILAMLGIGFHSMYCARPTGEHHYFTAPLADISKIFNKIYKSLASMNRPSRYITMTSSSGKISLLGTAEINGEKVFALKFNEGRNMDWMDRVYFAKYDENENTIEKLKPYGTNEYFYAKELIEIETRLADALQNELHKSENQ